MSARSARWNKVLAGSFFSVSLDIGGCAGTGRRRFRQLLRAVNPQVLDQRLGALGGRLLQHLGEQFLGELLLSPDLEKHRPGEARAETRPVKAKRHAHFLLRLVDAGLEREGRSETAVRFCEVAIDCDGLTKSPFGAARVLRGEPRPAQQI